ncbi:putative uncharacterized protein [Candidatus Colimorpha enterica]|uniref:Beta-galactosidase trimerisation domain-containing protein n=1 Tax=Candidatus Colimorpha enterica TaxID=3083063 RepID=R6TJ39_9BACT|nr:putative uncharacterized protein [Candidatus Colimorpha enterica]
MLTQRLGFENQKDENYIKELIRIIGRNPGSCDEIWLATDYGFPPLGKHRESASLLGKSAELLKAAGIRVSLQISNTIGHGDYMGVRDCSGLDGAERFTDVDGVRAEYSFCWHGTRFREYLAEVIRIYCAAIMPHRVWIDDDFRYDNHSPAGKGCMCDSCLKRFNKRYGTLYDRQALSSAVRNDPRRRKDFSEFITDGLCETAEFIARTAVSASPGCSIGYQHGVGWLPTESGCRKLFEAFEKGSGKSVGTRPGAGTYNDLDPSDMIRKLDSIGYQCSVTAGMTDEVRPEIENFPHVAFGKSPAGTCYETSLYLAGGADAMSYATMMYGFEPLSWHGEFFRAFSLHRRYWEILSGLSRTTSGSGIVHYIPEDAWKRHIPGNRNGYDWAEIPWYTGNGIRRCGIPVTFDRNVPEPLYMLTAECAEAMSAEDVNYLSGKPVFCGGDALAVLCNRGFGNLFSASAEMCDTLLLYETYSDHPVNGEAAGRRWENGLLHREGAVIYDRTGETGILGTYGCDGNAPGTAGGISSATVKTSSGAEWYVTGQYPWTPIISHEKRGQMIRALDRISGRRLSAYSKGRHEVLVLPRENREKQTVSVTVLNTTVGTANGILLDVRRPAGRNVTAYLPDGNNMRPGAVFYDGGAEIALPAVQAWNFCTVVFE